MMLGIEIRYSLQGAWRLFRRDPAGIILFNPTLAGYWRSFWAAIIVAPAFVLLDVLVNHGQAEYDLRYLLIHLIAYVIDWTAFPVAMLSVADGMGKRSLYLRYIAAYNWSSLVQMACLLPTALLAIAIPHPVTLLLAQGITVWLLVYRAYIARIALQTGWGMPIAIVLLDILLASAGRQVTELLLRGTL